MRNWKTSLASVLLAAGLIGAAPQLAKAGAGELHIYNWTDYTSPDMVKKFESETGIKVTIDTYDSNETALAKLSSGAAGYDVIIISNDFIPIFVKQGLLQKVDVAHMPNFKNLDPQWQKRAWDPDAQYSVPWVWGTTSYSVDTAVYKGPTDSLKPLFEPPPELKGKVGMFGSPTEVMSLALVYLGKPQCNSNPDDLKALNALLQAQKPFVKVYNSDGTVERQVSGETVMHEQWSGKALATRTEKSTFVYVYPKEGVVGWMDNVAVPKDAPDLENAKKFLNFLMDPQNIALQSQSTGYQTAVTGSNKFLPPEIGNSPEFNPPADLKITFAPSCDEKAIRAYDKIWTGLRQ
ncbi:MAG TPA: extracellular solute-binding protein [Hypericibacter adhaerens]|jgi:spermidine/putrescine transport system substrate-binding protein|uniref:Putrescine-binding periplasmic protein n=1 Tax=Hypericibacter adhaerens TaxID=2602016 RepID=A0A5J6N112_9PROT|nr:extracellular solute-binding protein [Hypericibacter adhaerens]QEX23698.1 ABC transporter [Hypericibacter adhaerens]HWA45612.1 extracellular solute-binding protein [Hypericibacter adhaerens]